MKECRCNALVQLSSLMRELTVQGAAYRCSKSCERPDFEILGTFRTSCNRSHEMNAFLTFLYVERTKDASEANIN